MQTVDYYAVMLKDYPDALTVSQAARILQVSTKSLYKLIHSGKIRAVKIGKTHRIPKIKLIEYLCLDSKAQ